MTVVLQPDQQVIITAKPKHEDIPKPYWYKWLEKCKTIPEDEWPVGKPKVHGPHEVPIIYYPQGSQLVTTETEKVDWCTCKVETVKISEMHTMRLVNSIKWCVKLAQAALNQTTWSSGFGTSKASLLATSPQWKCLLYEAKKRKLHMIYALGGRHGYAQWYEEARKAIVWNGLEE